METGGNCQPAIGYEAIRHDRPALIASYISRTIQVVTGYYLASSYLLLPRLRLEANAGIRRFLDAAPIMQLCVFVLSPSKS